HREPEDPSRAGCPVDGGRSGRDRAGARADRPRPRGPDGRGDRASDPLADGCGAPQETGRTNARLGRGREDAGVKPEALRGPGLSADGIDGAVLAQTLLVPDDHHRVLLLKGRILTRDDWPVVAGARVEELHVVRMEPGDIHEDEAARRLAHAVAGPGVVRHGPVESQVRLSAEVNGIFKVDVQQLQALNSIEDISIFTLFDGQLVSKGKTLAGVKVTPFVVREARLMEAERVAGPEGVIRVLTFRPMRVAVLVRERLEPAQREKFQASIEMKVAWFGSATSEIRYVADDVGAVEAAVRGMLGSADLLLTAGANATDPLDPTLVALGRLGAQTEK